VSYVGIIVSFALVNNVLLTELLGLSPVFGATRRLDASVALGVSITLVSGITALIAWVIDAFVLTRLQMGFLRIIVVVLAAAGTTALLELLLSRVSRVLYRRYGAFFPLLTANSAVVGVALIIVREGYGPLQGIIAGASAGAGALLAMVLLFTLRERLELEWVPRAFRGVPITLITSALMAMAILASDKSFLVKLLG